MISPPSYSPISPGGGGRSHSSSPRFAGDALIHDARDVLAVVDHDKNLGIEGVKMALAQAREAFFRRQLQRKRRHFLLKLCEFERQQERLAEALSPSATRLDAFMAHPTILKLAGQSDPRGAIVLGDEGQTPQHKIVFSSLIPPQMMRSEIARHQGVLAQAMIIISARIAKAEKAAAQAADKALQRRVKTLAWRQRRVRLYEMEAEAARKAEEEAAAQHQRLRRRRARALSLKGSDLNYCKARLLRRLSADPDALAKIQAASELMDQGAFLSLVNQVEKEENQDQDDQDDKKRCSTAFHAFAAECRVFSQASRAQEGDKGGRESIPFERARVAESFGGGRLEDGGGMEGRGSGGGGINREMVAEEEVVVLIRREVLMQSLLRYRSEEREREREKEREREREAFVGPGFCLHFAPRERVLRKRLGSRNRPPSPYG